MTKNRIYFFALMIIVSVLLTINLASWPVTWYDEGVHLQAAKNFSLLDQYGLQSTEGFRTFDPLINVGPTVILPIAMLFKVFGIGLFQARMVVVIYSLVTVMLFYSLSALIFDKKTAFTASLLLISIPFFSNDTSGSFLGLSRMILGEIPAFCFGLAGIAFWFKSNDNPNKIVYPIVSGIFFSLAIITKQQYLNIIVVIIINLILDILIYKRNKTINYLTAALIPIFAFAGMTIFQANAGQGFPVSTAEETNRISTLAIASLSSPVQILRNIRILLNSGILIWGLPGLIYCSTLCNSKNPQGSKICFLITTSIVWLAWFTIASIGWIRYVFPALAIMCILIAKLFAELSNGFEFNIKLFRKSIETVRRSALSLALIVSVGIIIITSLQGRIDNILTTSDTSAIQFANYIDSNVADKEAIESFEPEIVFYSARLYHQPSLGVLISAIRHVQFGEAYTHRFVKEEAVHYLVNGPFAKWTEYYSETLKKNNWDLVYSYGQYDLYQLK